VTKKFLLAVLVVVLLAGTVGLVAGCGGNLPKDAVAKVGSVIITQKAFDQRVAEFEKQYAGQIPDKATAPEDYKLFQQDVLEYMITFEMASQAAKDMKVAVTDADVQTEIDKILKDTFAGDQTKFDEALATQGITLDQLKISYKESMLLQKVYDEVTKSVTTVPDSDIQAYYDAHKTDYFVAETRIARHILLTPAAGRVDGTTTTSAATTTTTAATGSSGTTPATSASTTTTAEPTQVDWDSALAGAKAVEQLLKDGGDWTAIAKQYSDDPGSKETGGDLGTISKGEMVQEFEDAVFSQEKDAISDPVKTAYGYHVIQVTGINAEKQYTLDEVKEEIKSSLVSEAKTKAWQTWIEDQKKKGGVVYGSAWVTTTTTTAATTVTTAPASTATTAADDATTTTVQGTITTAGATSTTGGSTSTSQKD
jgi:parvulin-like peptidyl-prolyl isomerase